jgi:hypothetical protein
MTNLFWKKKLYADLYGWYVLREKYCLRTRKKRSRIDLSLADLCYTRQSSFSTPLIPAASHCCLLPLHPSTSILMPVPLDHHIPSPVRVIPDSNPNFATHHLSVLASTSLPPALTHLPSRCSVPLLPLT